MSKLRGKVAVVTAASKGIGAGIAKALAAEGASIVVNYASSKAGADTVVAAIVAAGGKAVAVGGDVSKAADAQGIIINIGSGVSRLTPAYSTVYTATKGALDAITGVLARELGPRKIRVNTINPGVVETEGTHSGGIIGSDLEKNLIAQAPLGRTGVVGDIAPIAVFLASDDSAWLTGEHLLATGGIR
jgi:3-oxoacyl-[acyl-carrier protein] reductase